jgi:tRNA dimethylallyltransferase
MQKPKLICIVGPTASGKSALAVRLAKALGRLPAGRQGEVVSADSRQVYRGLNIGTGKVTKKEMAGVPHHMLDVANPKRVYSAAQYVTDARKAIAGIYARGKIPIICGGTGFYIDTLLGRMSIPEVPPNLALRKKLIKRSPAQLFAQLKKLDPAFAQRIDAKNPVRLVRAIEIAKALGRVPAAKPEEFYEVLTFGITRPMEILEKRIRTRLHGRMKQGMLAETKRLHKQGLSYKRMEELGLEYRYMARHLQGKLTRQEMLEELEKEIVKYAKRQMTWFKKNKDIRWFSPSDTAIIKACKQFLT